MQAPALVASRLQWDVHIDKEATQALVLHRALMYPLRADLVLVTNLVVFSCTLARRQHDIHCNEEERQALVLHRARQ